MTDQSTLEIAMVTIDCTDPEKLAAWWADAVSGEVTVAAPGAFVMVTSPQGLRLGFQKVPDRHRARTGCT